MFDDDGLGWPGWPGSGLSGFLTKYKMAEDSRSASSSCSLFSKRKRRYNEYIRHRNPFKFPAARRKRSIKKRVRSVGCEDRADKPDSDSDKGDSERECQQFSFEIPDDVDADDEDGHQGPLLCVGGHEDIGLFDFSKPEQDITVTYNASIEQIPIDCEYNDSDDSAASGDDFLINVETGTQTKTNNLYEQFIVDENAYSECSSVEENSNNSESETECEVDHDPQLYYGSPITVSSSILLALSFVQKHKLTGEAFADLLTVIEAHCPKPNNCKKTVKTLYGFLRKARGEIVKHIFCGYCKAYVGRNANDSAVKGSCRICGSDLGIVHGFFVEVPLMEQLKDFFKDPEFVEGIKYRFQRQKTEMNNIEDVYDGYIYKQHFTPGGFLSDPLNISVKLNTDGVAIFRSSNFGVWPLFLLINELPPAIRTKKKYRVFAGLWFGEEKPFFSSFFKPFIAALQDSEVNGVDVVLPDGTIKNSKVMALTGHFDLPARAGALEQVPYICHDSCCYCTEPGEVIKTGAKGHVMSFPFRNTMSGHAAPRTAENVIANSYDALDQNTTVNGLKGPSALLQLPNFDIVNGIGIDSMHCIFLGVVKQLVGLWFNSKHSSEKWYCGNKVEKVDERLLQIKPPNVITRVPRSIGSHIKFWKATEYRNWFFYYSLPCMKGILEDEYYQHYGLLVTGIFILCSESISPKQLEVAGQLLMHFVEMIDAYYAPRYVLMNQHMLLHLKENVMANGPLWCSSLFTFEDWNGDIANFFHGTQNIAGQIMTAVSCYQKIPELIRGMLDGQARDIVLTFQGHRQRTNRTHLKGHFYAIGSMTRTHLNPVFEDDLATFLGFDSVSSVKFFTRLQIGDKVLHCRMYKRVTKRNTFTIAYTNRQPDLKYGQVELFFNAPTGCTGAVILPMRKKNECVCKEHDVLGEQASHIVTLCQPARHSCEIISLEDIVEVCIYMKFAESCDAYAAHFVNHVERD